ncbi:MAG: amino acid ABC transporter substrate-binding protein [Streptosporangiales bacterium]|nr:amino acid ABC transporter substrate-binding protein [Streptosporangiales bacterium]
MPAYGRTREVRSRGRMLLAAILVLALGTAACGGGSGGGAGGDKNKPIKIGISLPLTGNFSQPGKEARRGYEIWRDQVNAAGGLLGRKVQLTIVDDASSQKTIVSDYQRLISQDKVDLLLGTFSSLLNLPASAVAEKNQMLYVEPAGGSPEMFSRGFTHLFFAQQATAPHQADQLAAWLCSQPASKRPKTAAYVSQDDPFAKPVVSAMQPKLEKCGVKTVYGLKTYAADQTSFDAIVNGIKASKAEAVFQGAVFDDAVGVIRQMRQVDYSPKLLFQTSAPSESDQYAKAIGTQNTEGVFYTVSWDPLAKTTDNQKFVTEYKKRWNGAIPAEDAADAYAAAQVLATAVKGVGSLDQDKLADYLHGHTVDTVLGKLSWDKTGAPKAKFLLAQWQGGTSRVVLPTELATSKKIVYPKPPWH